MTFFSNTSVRDEVKLRFSVLISWARKRISVDQQSRVPWRNYVQDQAARSTGYQEIREYRVKDRNPVSLGHDSSPGAQSMSQRQSMLLSRTSLVPFMELRREKLLESFRAPQMSAPLYSTWIKSRNSASEPLLGCYSRVTLVEVWTSREDYLSSRYQATVINWHSRLISDDQAKL